MPERTTIQRDILSYLDGCGDGACTTFVRRHLDCTYDIRITYLIVEGQLDGLAEEGLVEECGSVGNRPRYRVTEKGRREAEAA